ncbi:MAG: DUF1631 family protein, partial [Gammaproteobacteria bacterium]|nr:DUF1631 family protein [Gammaproteobacteria bacterium]
MEKRQYVRLPLDLKASITVKGGRPQACQIRDFSLGGVFLSCKGLKAGKFAGSKPSALEQQPVEIAFSTKSGGGEKQYRVTGRIARVSKSEVAVEFVNADPATLLVMQEMANKAQKEFLDTREMESIRRKAAGDPAADKVENRIGIVELLKEMVGRFLKEGLEALFMEAREQLFSAAKKAANPVQETECMDALKELENIRSLVEGSFLDTVMGHVVKPGYTQLAGPESPKQMGGELTLVDPEKFQDWLRMKRILEKAGPKHKDNQYELHARLSAVSDTEIDEFNNPIGLVEICSSFYDSVQELGASRIAREAVFDALESAVVSKLGMLYAEVNDMLVGKGILPTVAPPKHVIKKNPRAEAPKSGHPSASPGTHQVPPAAGAAGSGAPHVGGAPAHAAAPSAQGSSAGGHSGGGHATHSGGGSSAPPAVASDGSAAPAYSSPNAPTASSSGAQPATAPAQAPAGSAQAAPSAAAAVESAGSGASPADTSAMHAVPGSRSSAPGHRQAAIPAAVRGAQPGASAYQAVHSLLGLQRQVHGSGTRSGSGAQGGSAPGAGGGGGASGPAYARNEVINALSSVQHQPAGEGGLPGGANLKQRIQSALEQQQPAGSSKQLGEPEDAAIDLTTGLVESIVEDVLVSDEIRSQFNRLQIPLIKAAMKNDNFFADSKHPARRVVDQLGALTIPKGDTGAKLRKIVNQVVNQIATGEGDGETEFATAAGQLDAVLNEQMASYEQNVRRVVEACEH